MGEAAKGALEVYNSFKGKLVTSTTDPATNVVTQVDNTQEIIDMLKAAEAN